MAALRAAGCVSLVLSVTIVLLCWELQLQLVQRGLLLVIGMPLTPVLDTLMFVCSATESHVSRHAQSWRVCKAGAVTRCREILEVLLEALPTAVLQSVVFLEGNTPAIGLEESLVHRDCRGVACHSCAFGCHRPVG